MINFKSIYICIVFATISIISVQAQNEIFAEDGDSLIVADKKISLLYGLDRTEKNNIYSVSHLDAEKLSKTNSENTFDALTGRLSGFRDYLVRGRGSTLPGPVVFLLDGFEVQSRFINFIDIEDIESVTVLKDAASTALYGQRGANGILSFKTKRGYIGKPVIKVEGTYGFKNFTEKPEYYNSYDYTGFYNEALQNDGLPAIYSEDVRNRYKTGGSEYYPSTDWYKETLKNSAPMGKFGLSVRGGSQVIKYFVNLNYLTQDGFLKTTDRTYDSQEKQDRFNFRANFDIQVFEKTNVKADVGGYIDNWNFPNQSVSAIYDYIQVMPPIIQSEYGDGTFGGNATYRNNPLALASNSGYAKAQERTFNYSFHLTQDLDILLDGLRAHGIVNYSNMVYFWDGWYKDFMVQNRTENGIANFGFESGLSWSRRFDQLRNFAGDVYLDYNKSWNDSQISGLLGFRQSMETMSGRDQNIGHLDYYGKVSYMTRNKYFADLIMSYSGSQNFDKGNRFGFFPALAAGWLISEEDFFTADFVKMLKLRGSIGLTGSDYISSNEATANYYKFMYFQQYQWSGGYNFGNDNAGQTGIAEGMVAYPGAKWENSLKTNIGVDVDLNNQFNVSLDFYIDKRSDILVTRYGSVPSLIGVTLPLNNMGKVINRGFEASVDYNYKVNDFAFNIGGYFNFNKSKVLEMNEMPRPHAYLERTNKPVGQYFGLETVGFFRDQADIDNSPQQMFSAVKPGDIKYKDQNNDGVIDEFDEIAIGKSSVPEITFAFYPSISYKNFTVEALFDGVANRSMYLNTSQFWGFYDQRNLATNAVEGRWTEANKENATLPRLTTMANENNYRFNDLWLENGSFIKLRYVELRYSFPENMLKKLRLKSAQLYLRGHNLYSFDHIKNADPENLSSRPSTSFKNIGLKLTF